MTHRAHPIAAAMALCGDTAEHPRRRPLYRERLEWRCQECDRRWAPEPEEFDAGPGTWAPCQDIDCDGDAELVSVPVKRRQAAFRLVQGPSTCARCEALHEAAGAQRDGIRASLAHLPRDRGLKHEASEGMLQLARVAAVMPELMGIRCRAALLAMRDDLTERAGARLQHMRRAG